ncbi:YD repeat-containing protein, partial [Sulfurirhabdus autotrophica]
MLSLTRLLTTPLLAGLLLLCHLSAQAETASLQLDNNGNITQRSNSQGTTTYSYDALNRLETETIQGGNTQTFKYDADGNRMSDGKGSYTYSPSANRMATRLGATVTLDPAGHITADGTGRTYTYNQAGQLATASKGSLLASYYYNAQGQRTRKVTTVNAPQGA